MSLIFNLTEECQASMWNTESIPSGKIFDALMGHEVLSKFHRLEEVNRISVIDFPGWVADLQVYAESNGITVYVE